MESSSGDSLRILTAISTTSFLFTAGLIAYCTYDREAPTVKEAAAFGRESSAKEVEIVGSAAAATSVTTQVNNFPDNDKTIKARLVAKRYISPDTVKLDFEFVDRKGVVPVGKHLKMFARNRPGVVRGQWNNQPDNEYGKEFIERKYTPTSSTEDGFVLVIKAYRPNEKYPDGGKMSQVLADLNTSDIVGVALPYGIIEYLRFGQFRRSKALVAAPFIGMLAGGSGITPMYRLLTASLADQEDTTKFCLIFANRSDADILLKAELEALAKKHPERLRVAYTLTRPPENWQGGVGLISKEMIRSHMPPPESNSLILCCGPPAMIKTCCKDNLEALGYQHHQIWDF